MEATHMIPHLPIRVVVVLSPFKKVTLVMAGPLTYATVTVLGLKLSMTYGGAYGGEMAIVTTGPVLSIRMTRTESYT
jgi:hypothetical protein